MANRGTVDGIQSLQSKAGKQYYKLLIDGQEQLAFGRTASGCAGISSGDQVEYSCKPTDSGDASMLTFIKKVSSGALGAARATVQPGPGERSPERSATPRPAYQGRSQDPTMQLSILYGYAKDLVAAGIVTTPVASPEGVADLVATVAGALMSRFKRDTSPEPVAEPATAGPQ